MNKKCLRMVFIICIIALYSNKVKAEDCDGENAIACGNDCGDDCYWEIDLSGTLTISGQGDMYESLYDESPWYAYRDSVEEVYVNTGITSVSDGAFYDLPRLSYAEISDTVTSIGSEAFVDTTLGGIVIGNNVQYIGGNAFAGLQYLNYISLPNSVTEIGDGAFYNTPLQNPTIPDSVTSIGGSAFQGSSWDSVVIPDSVTYIGDNAFTYPMGLTSLTLGTNVEAIGNEAFYGAYNLTDLTIPDSVIFIGTYAFAYAEKLKNLTISDNITTIPEGAFTGAKNLTTLNIPDSVTSIGMCAFCNAESLSDLIIPNSVITIETQAFSDAKGLQNLIIPDSVISIGAYAFAGAGSNNDGLLSLTIPDGASIGNQAFYNVKVSNLTISAEQLQAYLTTGGGDLGDGEDIRINCTSGDCKKVLNDAGYSGDNIKVSYVAEEIKNSDGSITIKEGNKIVGFKNKKIYTIDEANAVAGTTNRVSITYK